ncbi:amelotin [Sceloporus undulatus]|uniref:amelotin n=1 Tax=Sceloporus undulatus TaxID=8520 RepID=UPI001C4CF0EA|nr:amelotin [Sceloporus undulatus]
MKIVILLLSLLGLTFCLPVNQFGRRLATSNSREILRLQRYKAQGNIPQQTQQRPHPGVGLPPAKLVPDQQLLANQIPNEILPFEWPFANFPVFAPQNRLELGSPKAQNAPGFNVLPLTQMVPMDINALAVLLGALSTAQIQQQLLPPQPMLPIIFTQMGPQGTVLSSEEMPTSQVFAGFLVPGTQGGLFPPGQASLPEGQEGLFPASQAGTNPENTAAGIQKGSPTTGDGLNEATSGSYPTPSGFRQPGVVTNEVFVEPTVGINMEPSELREPPTSLVKLDNGNNQKHQNLSQSPVRGDSHMPINTTESKPLKAP